MKARSITKTALSVLVLAFAGTLSGVAQQAASPSAAPAVDHVKASAAEKVFIQKMAATVEAGRRSGALDMKAVSAVLDSAVKAGVSDAVMAQMVSMAAGAFPVMPPRWLPLPSGAMEPRLRKPMCAISYLPPFPCSPSLTLPFLRFVQR